jgi:hypothetical protein
MPREEVERLTRALREAQQQLTSNVIEAVDYESLPEKTLDGFTVLEMLQLWGHELRSHHRDLVLARGRLTGDNPHFHVPHFVRQANEDFGRFIGELACLTDEQLDSRVPDGGRTVREVAQHVLQTLAGHLGELRGAAEGGE